MNCCETTRGERIKTEVEPVNRLRWGLPQSSQTESLSGSSAEPGDACRVRTATTARAQAQASGTGRGTGMTQLGTGSGRRARGKAERCYDAGKIRCAGQKMPGILPGADAPRLRRSPQSQATSSGSDTRTLRTNATSNLINQLSRACMPRQSRPRRAQSTANVLNQQPNNRVLRYFNHAQIVNANPAAQNHIFRHYERNQVTQY